MIRLTARTDFLSQNYHKKRSVSVNELIRSPFLLWLRVQKSLFFVCVLTCRMQLVMSEAILACGVSSSLPCGCRLCSRHDSQRATSAGPCRSIELVSRIAVVMRVMQISTTAWSLSLVT